MLNVCRGSCCGSADIPEVPAGLPTGEEAERTPGLRGGPAAVRARHGQRVGAGDVGVHLPDVPSGWCGSPTAAERNVDDKVLTLFLRPLESAATTQRPVLRPARPVRGQRRLGSL